MKEKEKTDQKEIKTDDSRDIVEDSRLHWEKYINGNESFFSDLFQGQSFSEMCCTQCTKVKESIPRFKNIAINNVLEISTVLNNSELPVKVRLGFLARNLLK